VEYAISHYDGVTFSQHTSAVSDLIAHFTRFQIDDLQMIGAMQRNIVLAVQPKKTHIQRKKRVKRPLMALIGS